MALNPGKRSIFAGIGNVPAANAGNPTLKAGSYDLAVKEIRSFASKKPPFNNFFVVDFDILNSSNTAHKVGSVGSWLVNLAHSPALGNIKSFVMALTGVAESEINEEQMDELLGEDQPAAGLKIHCEVTTVTTKAGHPFDKYTFRALTDAESADLG